MATGSYNMGGGQSESEAPSEHQGATSAADSSRLIALHAEPLNVFIGFMCLGMLYASALSSCPPFLF